jgi:hypothetical protein
LHKNFNLFYKLKMVHLYRAAPDAPSNTNTYIMYGLGAVAVILGIIFLYRRQKKTHQNKDDEKEVEKGQPVSPSTAPSMPPTPANMKPVNVL